MGNKSIREIGQAIVSRHSPYDQQLGSFSGFLSPERKMAWHRINIEHLLMKSNDNQERIQQILFQGFQENISLLGIQNEIMHCIESGIQDMAKEMVVQRDILQSSQLVLKQILDSIRNPRAIEASEKARQASRNILDAKELSKERANRLLSEAVELLKESLEINDYDYQAHLDLGWLYSIYLNDLEKAEYHFDTAVLRSISKDKKFAAYSLRHLANNRKLLGRANDALKSISEAEQLENGKNLETRYEFARYLIVLDKENEATVKLKEIIEINPAYYTQTKTEPEFINKKKIHEMLDELLFKKRSVFINHINIFIEDLRKKYKTVVDKDDFETHINQNVEKNLELINNSTFAELTQKNKNDFQIKDKYWTTQEDLVKERKERLKKISKLQLNL